MKNSSQIWSGDLARLTNRTLLGLKMSSVWDELTSSLFYWQWTFFLSEISMKSHLQFVNNCLIFAIVSLTELQEKHLRHTELWKDNIWATKFNRHIIGFFFLCPFFAFDKHRPNTPGNIHACKHSSKQAQTHTHTHTQFTNRVRLCLPLLHLSGRVRLVHGSVGRNQIEPTCSF